jgi:hypothetical protein
MGVEGGAAKMGGDVISKIPAVNVVDIAVSIVIPAVRDLFWVDPANLRELRKGEIDTRIDDGDHDFRGTLGDGPSLGRFDAFDVPGKGRREEGAHLAGPSHRPGTEA